MIIMYDPPLEIDYLSTWREYLAELDPKEDAEEIARAKEIIARKIAKGHDKIEREIFAQRGLTQA